MTASATGNGKIFWAMDPSKDPQHASTIVAELKTWAKKLKCAIQPVAVYGQFPVLRESVSQPYLFEETAMRSAKRFLHAAGGKSFLEPKILFVPFKTTHMMAKALAEYADKQQAVAVFTYTRAQKNWKIFRLGGFAETLTTLCKTPVVLLNPNSAPTPANTSILFPTDFSGLSKSAMIRLAPIAKAFGAKVTLYNQVETLLEYASDFSLTPTVLDTKIVEPKLERRRLQKANEWTHLLQAHGVQSSNLVKVQSDELAKEILSYAKKYKVGLIAMASNSGPISQALLGSTARDVLLQAKCPVIIFHRPRASRRELDAWRPQSRRPSAAKQAVLNPMH